MALSARNRLTSEQVQFFSLVHEAVRANPFSQSRIDLDLKITGLKPGATTDDRVIKLVQEIENRCNDLTGKPVDIRQYRGKEKTILKNSILFVLFHRFLDKFDTHIEDQVAAGKTPVPFAFADQIIGYLRDRGFETQEAIHYFSLNFQLRRAFYFIDQNIKGQCQSMIKLKESLWNNVFTNSLEIYDSHLWNRMEDFSTLILGETGTGKGAVATSIGRSGYIPFDYKKKQFKESFDRSFVSLNLSQYSENLIESELFGHKKGAFTGAVNDHKGVLEMSSPHGAIFLDEIGEVSIPVQIKLLKVLEERTFSPVGGYDQKRFKGRIIAATNRSIEDILDKKILRQDFFYRLCSDLIVMPPLRQRFKEDPKEMETLLAFTMDKILGETSKDLVKMVKTAMTKQPGKNYSWPGNVREFAQSVRRILLNHSYSGMHSSSQLPVRSGFLSEIETGKLDSLSLIQGYCYSLYQKAGTYGDVAKTTKLDRRTVKKYILAWEQKLNPDMNL